MTQCKTQRAKHTASSSYSMPKRPSPSQTSADVASAKRNTVNTVTLNDCNDSDSNLPSSDQRAKHTASSAMLKKPSPSQLSANDASAKSNPVATVTLNDCNASASSSPPSPASCVRPTSRDDKAPAIQNESSASSTALCVRLTPLDQSPTQQPAASPPSPAVCERPTPPSPTNREKFMAGLYVQTVGCCLDSCSAGPNVRLTFKGTVAVLYPINFNPERRYVVFMDEFGNIGLTIWNKNIAKITTESIGKHCEITKVTLTTHQGKKVISLSKDSEVRSVLILI